jgi:hypothetical protein
MLSCRFRLLKQATNKNPDFKKAMKLSLNLVFFSRATTELCGSRKFFKANIEIVFKNGFQTFDCFTGQTANSDVKFCTGRSNPD